MSRTAPRPPRPRAALPILLAVSALAACGTKIDPVQVMELPSASGGLTWCNDVRPILEAHCTSCHSQGAQGASRGGAPATVNLDTYTGAATHARRSAVRMQAGTMPPNGGVGAAEIAVVLGWIDAGMPECGAPGGDGSLPDVPVAADPGPPDPGATEVPSQGGVTWCGRIQGLVAAECTSCHASTHSGAARVGAPVGVDFDTYAAAVASAAAANADIQSGRMPLAGPLPASDRAAFQAWVDAGTPQCGGADGAPPPDVAVADPGPPVPTCTSGQHWSGGGEEDGNASMEPGRNCIACHRTNEATDFTAAGTIMGGLHDEDRCLGVPGVTVEITAHDGQVVSMTTNASGNFTHAGSIATPFRVRVLDGTRERRMATVQSDTNCMDCHTWAGTNGAPGRILAP